MACSCAVHKGTTPHAGVGGGAGLWPGRDHHGRQHWHWEGDCAPPFPGVCVCVCVVCLNDIHRVCVCVCVCVCMALISTNFQRGARVILACRDLSRAEAAVADIRASVQSGERSRAGGVAETMVLDLASLSSVRAFAAAFLALEIPLHILVNNGGINAPRGS